MDGLAASLAGTQTYDANQNTTTHYYAGKGKAKATPKKKPVTISKKK